MTDTPQNNIEHLAHCLCNPLHDLVMYKTVPPNSIFWRESLRSLNEPPAQQRTPLYTFYTLWLLYHKLCSLINASQAYNWCIREKYIPAHRRNIKDGIENFRWHPSLVAWCALNRNDAGERYRMEINIYVKYIIFRREKWDKYILPNRKMYAIVYFDTRGQNGRLAHCKCKNAAWTRGRGRGWRNECCIFARAVSESPVWPHVSNHIFLYKFMRTRVGSPFTDIDNAL